MITGYTYPADRPPHLPRLDDLVHADDPRPGPREDLAYLTWATEADARTYGGGIAARLAAPGDRRGAPWRLSDGYAWIVCDARGLPAKLFLPRTYREGDAAIQAFLRGAR